MLAAEWGLSPCPQSDSFPWPPHCVVPMTTASLRCKPMASQILMSKGMRVPGLGGFATSGKSGSSLITRFYSEAFNSQQKELYDCFWGLT